MKQLELSDANISVSSLRAQLLRMSADRGRTVASAFYAELFSKRPSLRAHFAGLDVNEQAAKLWSVLRLVVAMADDQAAIAEATRRVGRAHASRRIDPDDYDAFIETLAGVLAHSQRTFPADKAKQLWLRELTSLRAMVALTRHR
jgi:hemoglobin-like flavoprotein